MTPFPRPTIPPDLRKALASVPKAKGQWESLTPVAQRDFISWIESAKQEETRKRRIIVACSKLLAGQRRPCCYAVVPMPLYKALGSSPKAKAQWSTLTADEKRDFADWVESPKESHVRKERVGKVCDMLAAGRRRP